NFLARRFAMNCHAARRLIFAERDGALTPEERAALGAHLMVCPDCRQARAALVAVIDDWRAATKAVQAPDAERAWQDIARAIRADREKKTSSRGNLLRWSLPLAAAAAL